MGVKTGEWLYFQEDGKPSKTLNYEDNVFDGLQSYFHKNGKPFKTKIYNNDGSIFILETEKNQRNESYQYIFYDNAFYLQSRES